MPAAAPLSSAVVPMGGERPCPTLDRMLRLGRIDPGQTVAVAGPARLAAQIGLLRKGFGRVVSACGDCDGEADTCDAVLLTGPCPDAMLEALADRAARLLKPGGVLVAHELSPDGDVGLARVLRAHGLEPAWVLHDMAAPCLAAMGVQALTVEMARAA